MTTRGSHTAFLPTHPNGTLAKARKLIQSLVRNREKAWHTANFKVDSKLSALRHLKIQLEASEKWGRDGHYHLFWNNRHIIRSLIPGEDSHFQGLRNKAIAFMDQLEAYYPKAYPNRVTNN